MATALTFRPGSKSILLEAARLHFMLRFSVGTTAAFVVCEWMGWQPSALAPVLTGVLLANLPVSPPPKVGLALVLVMGVSAWFAFFLTTCSSQTPSLLFGVIGLIMFLAFAGLAQAKAQLPLTLLLMCISVVPVVTLTVSQYAGIFSGTACARPWRSPSFSPGSLCDLAAAIAEKSRSAGRPPRISRLPLPLSERRSSFR